MDSSVPPHNDGQVSAHHLPSSSQEPHHRLGSHGGPFTVDGGGGGGGGRLSATTDRHPQAVATGPHGPPLWDSLTASASQPRRAIMYASGSPGAPSYPYSGQAVVGQNGMEWPVVRNESMQPGPDGSASGMEATQIQGAYNLPAKSPGAFPNTAPWPQGFMGGPAMSSSASHGRYSSQEQVLDGAGRMSRQSSRSRSNSIYGSTDVVTPAASAVAAHTPITTPPAWGEGQLFAPAVHTEHTQQALALLHQQQQARRMQGQAQAQAQAQQSGHLGNIQTANQFQQYRQVQPAIMSPLDAPSAHGAGHYGSPLNSATGSASGSSAPPWVQQHYGGSASSVSSPTSYAHSARTDPRSRTTTNASILSDEGGVHRMQAMSKPSSLSSLVSGPSAPVSVAPSPPGAAAQHVIPRRGSFGADDSALDDDLDDPDAMAQKDPLATQVWKMYAREKNAKPHAARMENLTWRMMALALRKKKEEEEAAAAAAAGATASSSNVSSRPRTPASHASSRRSSGSDDPSHATFRGLAGLTSISDDPAAVAVAMAKGKGKTRFAELQEERGRRGRSSKTPESTGSINTSAEEVMDWRATSKSRSRSRSMSNMDWRGASRSRSRAPASSTNPTSTLQEHLGTIDDDDDSESLLSRSAPNQPGFTFGDFVGMVDTPPAAREAGHTSGNGLTPLLAFANLPAPFGSSQSSPAGNSRTVTSSALNRLEFAPSGGTPGATGSATTPSDKARMQQAFKMAAHTDLFPMAGNLSPAVPFLYGGRKTSWDMSSIGANPLGAPLSTLGSVPGIGDYGGHSGNQHPEYGFLPRLVRKTSFDHKVRSLSRGPPQPPLQPPVAQSHASSNLLQQPPVETFGSSYNSSPPAPIPSRKRPYEPSPARPRIPTSGEQRMASGLSRQAPAPFTFQNASGTNMMGGFTAPAFEYTSASQPAHAAASVHGPPVVSATRSRDGKDASAAVGSSGASSGRTSIAAGTGDSLESAEPTSSDLEVIMNFLYNPDVRNEQTQPFTHINPNQVFRFNGPSSGSQADLLGGGVTEGSDGESSAWTYSPANTSSPVATPGPGGAMGSHPTEGGAGGWQAGSRRQSGENKPGGGPKLYDDEDSPGRSPSSAGGMAKALPPTACSNCSTTKTPLWRRDPSGQPLCNACGLFFKLHGKIRPLSLKTDVIKKRNRAQPVRDRPRGSGGGGGGSGSSGSAGAATPAGGFGAITPSGQSSGSGGAGNAGGAEGASKGGVTTTLSSKTSASKMSSAEALPRPRASSIITHAQGRTAHGATPVSIAPAPPTPIMPSSGGGGSLQADMKRQRRMETK